MANGYIKLPRSLLQDSLWKTLSYQYRHVFITILENMAWKETSMDDFGVVAIIKPGQLMITERELAKKCDEPDINRCLVQRALMKFEIIGFSIQTSIHKKTIITITRKDILELIDPNFDHNSIQTRSIKEDINTLKPDLDLIDLGKKEFDPKTQLRFEHKIDGHVFANLDELVKELTSESWTQEEVNLAIQRMKKQNPILNAPIKNYLTKSLNNNREKENLCKKTQKATKVPEKNLSKQSLKDKGYYTDDDIAESPLAKSARLAGLN